MSSIRTRHGLPAGADATVPARAPARAPEVIVVTHDRELEDALRRASPATPMRVATTPAALADLLLTGRAGALVLDVGALDAAALTVARHLAEQFPDVPLVAVGSREDEARLASLISRGLIYRFLHRPVSAARARTFIEAALRRAGEIGAGAALSAARAPLAARPRQRPMLALAAAGGAATLGLGFWLALQPPPASPPPASRPAVVAHAAGPVERAPPPVAAAAPSGPAAVAGSIAREPAPPVRPAAALPAPPVAPRRPPETEAAPVASARPVAAASPAEIAASEAPTVEPAPPASAPPDPPAQDLPGADARPPGAG